ncbi:MAG: uroporphyrinogen-III synthase [Ardenticatenales bacterium]
MIHDRRARPPRPLAGRRVVVTRAEGASDAVAAQLRGLGADVLSCDSIRFAFAPLDADTPLDGCVRRLADYDWLVFTSATAVRAVVERPSWAPPADGRPRIASVGRATVAACRKSGLPVDRVGAGTAADLASDLIAHPDAAADVDVADSDDIDDTADSADTAETPTSPTSPASTTATPSTTATTPTGEPADDPTGTNFPPHALFPHADIARPELPDGLRAAGWTVDAVEAYRTTAIPPRAAVVAALAEGVDAVAFASPSAVRALVDGLSAAARRGLARAALVCIGPTTAAAVAAAGLSVAVVAAEPSGEGLAAAVVGVLDTGDFE